jgi:hypothetical protein
MLLWTDGRTSFMVILLAEQCIALRRFGTTFPFFSVSKVSIVSVNICVVTLLRRIPKPALRPFQSSRPPVGTHETVRDPSKTLS